VHVIFSCSERGCRANDAPLPSTHPHPPTHHHHHHHQTIITTATPPTHHYSSSLSRICGHDVQWPHTPNVTTPPLYAQVPLVVLCRGHVLLLCRHDVCVRRHPGALLKDAAPPEHPTSYQLFVSVLRSVFLARSVPRANFILVCTRCALSLDMTASVCAP
jgi:hypothetical protein